jgi:hypothetical protein
MSSEGGEREVHVMIGEEERERERERAEDGGSGKRQKRLNEGNCVIRNAREADDDKGRGIGSQNGSGRR